MNLNNAIVALALALCLQMLPSKADAVLFTALCDEGAPPSGFTGPDPTTRCLMDWIPGGQIVRLRHTTEIEAIAPSSAQGDSATWGPTIVPIIDDNRHWWVMQIVCVSTPTATVKHEAWGTGWRVKNAGFPIEYEIWGNLYDYQQGTYESGHCS